MINKFQLEKRNGLKKPLDKQVSLGYNESIKSKEWFLAHSPNKELDYGYH